MKKIFKKLICLCFSVLMVTSMAFASGCAGSSKPATWLVNNSAPTASSKGNVGDMWLDTSTYNVYEMTKNGWLLCGNIKSQSGSNGTDGAHGQDGVNGTDGATWFTGEGSPALSNLSGKIGDMYLDTKNFKVYKMSPSGEWEFWLMLGVADNPTQNMTWNDDGELKILLVGNSFSDDTSYYLWKVANSAGVENVTIGHLHIGGCDLTTHLVNAQHDAAVYDYRLTDNEKKGAYSTTTNYKYSDAVKSENWDYISFQQVSGKSGLADTFSPLPELIDLYSDLCPTAQIVWNMTWAYEGDSTHANFSNYGNDQMQMYNAIVSAVSSTILTNPNIDMVSPTGTAIQNARAVLGDTATRDGFHLAYEGSMGTGTYNARYIAALAFFGKLSGISLDKVTYAPDNVDATTKAVAIQAAQDAIRHMFNTSKPEPDEPDEPSIEDTHELLTINWTGSAEYNSAFPINPTAVKKGDSYKAYFATQTFTKAEIPVGSIIEIADGWTYRPEGWIDSKANSADTRPAEVTTTRIVIDETWWGEWTMRAFNIRKTDNSDLTGLDSDVADAFKIYIPKK